MQPFEKNAAQLFSPNLPELETQRLKKSVTSMSNPTGSLVHEMKMMNLQGK